MFGVNRVFCREGEGVPDPRKYKRGSCEGLTWRTAPKPRSTWPQMTQLPCSCEAGTVVIMNWLLLVSGAPLHERFVDAGVSSDQAG